MHKSSKRAERRHHYQRLKRKRITNNYWCRYHGDWSKSQLGISVNTPKPCSCEMCGNPRRHFRESTLSERKSIHSMKEEIEQVNNEKGS